MPLNVDNIIKEANIGELASNIIERISLEALDSAKSAWIKGKGYDSSGNLVTWHGLSTKYKMATGRKNPPLNDTGNMLNSLEVVLTSKEDERKFEFQINDTGTSSYGDRKRKKGSTPVHAKNLSIWHSDRSHLGTPKEYDLSSMELSPMVEKIVFKELDVLSDKIVSKLRVR